MKATSILFVSMMLIALSSIGSYSQERKVRVAGDPYPPWAEGEVGSKPTGGIAVEIVEELFSRMGMKTDVGIYPLARGLERTRKGEVDVILMVSRSKEREQFMLFTDPIREVKFLFYYPSDAETFVWQEWEDLKPYNIGSVTAYNIGNDWKEAITKHDLKVEEVKTDIFNIEKLLLGRIDIFVTDHEVMQRTIEQNPKYQGKLKWNEKPVFESVNNLGISKKSFLASYLPEIDRVLQEMKADGTFDKIFCAYHKVYRTGCEKD